MQPSMCQIGVTNFPPKWKIYNVPKEKAVNYSFLLREKREFRQFLTQLKSEVSNMGSCSIIDKMSTTACEEDINIYIFDRRSYGFKNLHLKVLLPRQHLRKKISLLIHFASKNNATPRFQNRCMYIKSKDGILWETFCNIFAALMKRSCINLIGTQFYISLASKGMMVNEIRLLQALGRRLPKVKSNQTLVKSSVKKSCFPSLNAQDYLSKFVKPLEPIMKQTIIVEPKAKDLTGPIQKVKPTNVSLKRKFKNTVNDRNVKTLKVSHEFCRKESCKCQEMNKWKVFKRITRLPVVNYIDLLKEEFEFTDFENSQIYSLPTEDFEIPESLHVYENVKAHLDSSEKLFSNLKVTEKVDQSLFASHKFMDTTPEINVLQTGTMHDKLNDNSRQTCTSAINSRVTSGKAIVDKNKISDSEPKNKSYHTYNEKKGFENTKEIKQSSESSNNTLVVSDCKKTTETKPSPTPFQTPSMGFQSCNKNGDNNFSKGFQPLSSNTQGFTTTNFPTTSVSNQNEGTQALMGFQTAAGKSLNISEKAFLAAQKMFDEVCSQEINLFDKDADEKNDPKSKKPAYPGENDIEEDFNSDFAKKFFEEFPFDDKESELVPEVDVPQPILPKIENKVSQVGKVRKSLGGRRSLKPYSVKK